MWRRASPLVRTPRSWDSMRSSRIRAPAVSRASLAWARPIRARTSSDLTAGTDTPSAPTYANPPGLNAFLEMRGLVASGESPAQVFRSATIENAKMLVVVPPPIQVQA